ncbi:hypothetical protein BB561_004957 [Smittium simulii]|uniref:RCK N-terminal domain-containing protein n=1 Tax=Smittium simulii TaxID=133385 RepID=A0A2T9YD55_9FUNG|nr:hypothetical protein BB561_004957 [Smittium simulii]
MGETSTHTKIASIHVLDELNRELEKLKPFFGKSMVANIKPNIHEKISNIFKRNKRRDKYTPTRQQLITFYLNSTNLGQLWYILDALINTFMALLFIFATTYVDESNSQVPIIVQEIDCTFAWILLFLFLPRGYIAPNFRKFVFSDFFVVSLLTIISPLMIARNRILDPTYYEKTLMAAGYYVYTYPLRFYRLKYIFGQIFKSTRNPFKISIATQKAIESIATVTTVIMAITALTYTIVYQQRITDEEQVMSFGDVLFYTSVSSITGLTSDVVPNTLFTRGVAIFIMFLGIIWMPPKMSEVLSVIEKRNPLPKSYKPEPHQKHVLVIGDLNLGSLVEFLREFFSQDHGQQIVNTKVVLMSENEPDSCVQALLNDPSYKTSVMFMLGSPVSPKSLRKAQIEKASSIFILSSKNVTAKSEDDYRKVMIAMSVKRYLLGVDAKVNIYAQTLLPETSLYLERITDHVICIPELRLGILTQGVSVPGFSSLIQALVTSIPRNMEKQLKKIVKNDPHFYWIEEYISAIGQEIYQTKFSPFFRGMKFKDVAKYIYSNFNSILISVKPKKSFYESSCNISSCRHILTNPATYVFKGDEIGYLISTNSTATDEIEKIPVECTSFRESSSYVEPGDISPLIPKIKLNTGE